MGVLKNEYEVIFVTKEGSKDVCFVKAGHFIIDDSGALDIVLANRSVAVFAAGYWLRIQEVGTIKNDLGGG